MADGPWNDFKPAAKKGGPWEDFAKKPGGGDASGKEGGTGAPQQPTFGRPGETGAYQSRPGGTILNAGDSAIRSGAVAAEKGLGVKTPPSSYGDMVGQIGSSLLGSVKDEYGRLKSDLGGDSDVPGARTAAGVGAAAMTPFGVAASGIEGMAKGVETATQDIGTGFDKGDTRAVGSGLGSIFGLKTAMVAPDKMMEELTPHVADAARHIQRYAAINQGEVKVVNGMVRSPLAALDGKVTQEINSHVESVLAADKFDNLKNNNPVGSVNTADAAKVARAASEKIGGEFANKVGHLIDRAAVGTMDMREAKALTSDVGTAAAQGSRSGGGAKGSAVLWELYDSLHEATADRANSLGKQFGGSWQHYIDEARSMKQMEGGLMGKLVDEPNHAKALKQLIDPDNATEVKEIQAKMKQYGVDPEPLNRAVEIGTDLHNLSQETKNAFVGKIRSIMKYPTAAGAGAAAASMIGSASKIPGMGFVLPLIVAGKIGGLLDNAAIKGILKEIDKRTAGMPNVGQIHDPGKGPMPVPTPPTGGAPTPPVPGGPGGKGKILPLVKTPMTAAEMNPAANVPAREATMGEAEDMKNAQIAEDERQIMAKKVGRARSKGGKITQAAQGPTEAPSDAGAKRQATIDELTKKISALRGTGDIQGDEYNNAMELRKQLRKERGEARTEELNKILGDLSSSVRKVADKHYQETIPIQDKMEQAADAIKNIKKAKGKGGSK